MNIPTHVFAAVAVAAASPAAAASYVDYSVYAATHVSIAGGSYGTIASATFDTSHAIRGGNYVSQEASSTSLTAQALATSRTLGALAATGSFAVDRPTRGTLTGTGAGLNVFAITGDDLAGLTRLSFAGPGTGAIVNVTGAVGSTPLQYDFGGLDGARVVFNFVDATSVSFSGADIRGSILAPLAALSYAGGRVAGTVAADSFSSAGTEIGGAAFVAPGGVPEPATWALMILGFGAAGAALRRRGQSSRAQYPFPTPS